MKRCEIKLGGQNLLLLMKLKFLIMMTSHKTFFSLRMFSQNVLQHSTGKAFVTEFFQSLLMLLLLNLCSEGFVGYACSAHAEH